MSDSPSSAGKTEPGSPGTLPLESADTAVGPLGQVQESGVSFVRIDDEHPEAPGGDGLLDARYTMGRVLCEGGMGEVRLVRDTRIGREVAAKLIRRVHLGRPDLRLRFEREAKIQGQLEHPAIVPVYDFGVSPAGVPFFTMKRVRGDTLEELVVRHRAGDVSVTRRKLLQALGQVCLAVQYAHERGALHRDLKPENVMLGAYGEVYVLDWGIAKVASDAAGESGAELGESGKPLVEGGPQTALGTISGTVGYMAPEQLRGEALDARTDVYSLGIMLFEVLTAERFIAVSTAEEMMRVARAGVDGSPARRAPHRAVPEDLDQLCLAATAFAAEDRLASARALFEGIEAHLDGDRDRARRRELAEEHAGKARAALGAFRGEGLRAAPRENRETAIRESSKALTLDPVHEGARSLMRELLLYPSEDLPTEGTTELERRQVATHDEGRKVGLLVYALWLFLVPAIWLAGIREPILLASFVGIMLALVALEAGVPVRVASGPKLAMAVVVLSTAALGCLSGLFGPLVLIPGWAAANGMTYTMVFARRSQRAIALGLSLATVGIPLALELSGLVPPSYTFRDGLMIVHPRLMHFTSPAMTLTILAVLNLLIVSIPLSLAGKMGLDERRRERELFVHSWNLRHFVPETAADHAAAPTKAR
ncbi:MAG: protein kinase [Polyangiaceae bacterium]|nr:protein kinase [Polyangiaceae bacterium]